MELGVFAQDAWKIERFTLNLGLRYDRVEHGLQRVELAEAGPYVPGARRPALAGVPIYNDINPRAGVAMDVFGNGRTAVKFSVGRYNQLSRGDFTSRFHPFNSSINSAFRNWTDVNGNFTPDCDVQKPRRRRIGARPAATSAAR